MQNGEFCDVTAISSRNIESAQPGSIEGVREAGKVLVVLSDDIYEQHVSLKRFLNKHLYSHEKKLEMTHQAQVVIQELFEIYTADNSRMPAEFSSRAEAKNVSGRARVVADYIAGMTDRYAYAEHERITAGATV